MSCVCDRSLRKERLEAMIWPIKHTYLLFNPKCIFAQLELLVHQSSAHSSLQACVEIG